MEDALQLKATEDVLPTDGQEYSCRVRGRGRVLRELLLEDERKEAKEYAHGRGARRLRVLRDSPQQVEDVRHGARRLHKRVLEAHPLLPVRPQLCRHPRVGRAVCDLQRRRLGRVAAAAGHRDREGAGAVLAHPAQEVEPLGFLCRDRPHDVGVALQAVLQRREDGEAAERLDLLDKTLALMRPDAPRKVVQRPPHVALYAVHRRRLNDATTTPIRRPIVVELGEQAFQRRCPLLRGHPRELREEGLCDDGLALDSLVAAGGDVVDVDHTFLLP